MALPTFNDTARKHSGQLQKNASVSFFGTWVFKLLYANTVLYKFHRRHIKPTYEKPIDYCNVFIYIVCGHLSAKQDLNSSVFASF